MISLRPTYRSIKPTGQCRNEMDNMRHQNLLKQFGEWRGNCRDEPDITFEVYCWILSGNSPWIDFVSYQQDSNKWQKLYDYYGCYLEEEFIPSRYQDKTLLNNGLEDECIVIIESSDEEEYYDWSDTDIDEDEY